MFPHKCFSGNCERAAMSVFGQNIADFVEFLRRIIGLVKHQTICRRFCRLVQGILSGKVVVEPPGGIDDFIERVKGKDADEIHVRVLFRFLSLRFSLLLLGCLFLLCPGLCLKYFLEQIQNIICACKLRFLGTVERVVGTRGEFREARIQFLRILHFSDDEYDAVCGDRNRLDHKRHIICLKS